MREILFRGRDTDGVWHEGFYCVFNGKSHRIYTGYAETDCGDYYPDYFNVDPDTVGQYIGLIDKNGTKIFEGDIVNFKTPAYFFRNCRVKYESQFARFCTADSKGYEYPMDKTFNYEIIGNEFDNPELLRK